MSTSQRLHLGTRKGLLELERHGPGDWRILRTSFPGVQVPMLLSDTRHSRLYAALDHGHFGTKMQVSTDGGATWEEITCPTYPPKPDDVPDVICQMSQQPVPWSLKLIWSLESGGHDQPSVLWCGTAPGGLFKSADHGATWSLVESLWSRPERAQWFGGGLDWPGIHTICVDPRDSQRVLLGISCGGVWESRDGGCTWACIGKGIRNEYMPPDLAYDPNTQDPHRLAWCHNQPDVVWMQHHNGIFHSSDGGQNWNEIHNATPSAFGFGVAVHPHDPDCVWFVPGIKDELRFPTDAALCVMRTRDGGKTFEPCRNGLPQDHAYHVVYRHALDISGDGQILAFASTTGSLWTSEDGGDSWLRVSCDLPPVYCVRFEKQA